MGLTPMMQQYINVKEKCKDCILFFRLGDFYEMFFEDAKIASRELELVLTGKDCGLSERAPMCGVPFHSANMYITKLISKGYKVAIGEQLENPASAKGIVKRGIVKIVTPGTYTDSSFLEDTKNNYIMSIFIDKSKFGISIADVSTGEFNCTSWDMEGDLIINEISKYSPKEILVQESLNVELLESIRERFNCSFTKFKDEFFNKDAYENLKQKFSNFDEKKFNDLIVASSNGLLRYLMDTQKVSLAHIDNMNYYNVVDYMSIDANSRRNLELTETLREKSKKGSLLWVLDKTSTAMGGRQLRRWIEEPLIDEKAINQRLDSVQEFTENLSLHEDLKNALKQVYDIERLIGKISTLSVNAKEMIFLKNSIEKLPAIKDILKGCKSSLLKGMQENLDDLKDIYNILDKSVLDSPSISIKEGNIIKDGYNTEVDELRQAKTHGKEWIAKLESSEREETGIKSLKVGYNKVFGYYIEITKSNLNLVPEGKYIRKQTLANCERYITEELKQMEEKILGAEEKLINIEYELFVEIRDKISTHIDRMKKSAKLLSELDCLCSFASVALENNYCKPQISTDGAIKIEEGRHPVVENMLSAGTFVANDTKINTTDEQLMLITGPNMAGKSTYMRQVALIVIMSQIGSFVPAKNAVISVCDRIFTRIGASDDLAAGKSTFMVEMWEVSNILKNATTKSLIILDEVGRGTSTYDGLSIAWSVVEYLCTNKNLKCKTLFATHYHELTALEGVISGLKNYSIAVKQIQDNIVFLRKIVSGGADQSYGIEVAKLAGLPEKVTKRAKEILEELEKDNDKEVAVDSINSASSKVNNKNKKKKRDNEILQLGFDDLRKEEFLKDISNIDIMNMTPMDCMNTLYKIIKDAKNF
ncbi:DNA mismatch repair protein MutS [Clostridium pasteurianum DSM 525 = ATCC 6013]|uniref:DNA mismatch repair protein MutS n=1 Tax=Clostridium pasteurianum DSM 525 = ATCC 6013 TaxID=1262449 RepID=A0A0H3J4T3_CLOPA|nr:DNA mismatch repair protein MutS [Clostridium pasteurianum]AJA48022.1 DNA mismatch repair protein MutS [Clostridium pasteurianum DSM 525 = ATCC 6013]AJA52010.1 DNA mismatch repair protein MutS [Clostridium pasteurianum DSM 525 = ATCC 6013]AOZ75304.1 DNA mismatch repair protein MutS [Clostridium pasteurianum DSM 525 = ATCC 6013]AOZ79099.1 DNA mismatch repair protein MutS [Clostridium pasteurianum]ELP59924.1 DNA mismatch repair protein MutS [Clostridium pasteurianum DSM 525 = ATCC 6013]